MTDATTAPARIKGVDISSWQHANGAPIDWWELYDAGYHFVIVKATQGTMYVNPWVTRDLDDARAAGLLVGAYHYWEAGLPADVQAKTFYNNLIGQELELGAWLDWEPPMLSDAEAFTKIELGNGQTMETPSAKLSQAVADISAFMAELDSARPGAGYYMDLAWHDLLARTAIPARRTWLASWGGHAPAGAAIWQDATDVVVKGVVVPVDTNVLLAARGINIPTSPPARPTAKTARRVTPQVDPDEAPAHDEREPDSEPITPAQ